MPSISWSRESERAAGSASVIAFRDPIPTRPCPACGAPMTGRRTSACSDRCRAAKSRRTRIPLPIAEAREIKAGLTMLLDTVWHMKATLAKYGA